MKHIATIIVGIIFSLVATLPMGCSNETDTALTSQQNSISKYLTGSHQPQLIPESEVASSPKEHPQYFTQWGLDIYRYISTMYEEGREERAIAERGDELSITYTAYVFTNNKPSAANMFATNDQASIDQLKDLGLNTEYEWSSEPMTIRLGSGDILSSIETALEGCHEGDNVEVYLTFEEAYGKHHVGMVPSKSAQVWYIDINTISKKTK
jgi:hypothetical protein